MNNTIILSSLRKRFQCYNFAMEIMIIPFEDQYLDQIRAINVGNSRHPNKPQEEKALARHLYIDYYALFSKENCFIAINGDSDEVVGYIISEPNFDRYKKHFLYDYMDEAKALNPDFENFLIREVGIYEKYNDQYKAHFHMDVKKGYQHQGIGTKLVQAELNHLKEIGCIGVMLLCSTDNENANKFYQKNGLDLVASDGGANIRGKKL